MLNNSQLIKRKQQINLHRRVPEKSIRTYFESRKVTLKNYKQ